MTAIVRQIRRTATIDAPASIADPVDYCECGRGPVIGAVIVYADRLVLFPLGNKKAHWPDHAPDLRCLDCVADASSDVASGVVDSQMREMARERGEQVAALMRRSTLTCLGEPVEDFLAKQAQDETSPGEGDCLT